MSADHPHRVTLSGRPPETEDEIGAPAPIDPKTGMHKDYWVLSEEERRKGLVRPVRETYTHVGRSVCGKLMADKDLPLPEGKTAFMCVDKPDHNKDCYIWMSVTEAELERFVRTGMLGGCDHSTWMNYALAETYARDPKFYGATFCAGCCSHFPVGPYGEFIWKGTNERVGT